MKTDLISSPVTEQMKEEAREAGLRYVSDRQPGITRKAGAKGFAYFAANGSRLRDAGSLARIKRLVIPPAWTHVWISASENGHIQAVGRDARGRKQYRYHDRWREQRDLNKYGHMLSFAAALPAIRRKVARDLRRPGLDRAKVLATVVRLLETTLIRVGNEEYARQNHSYGLTTLRNRHVKVRGGDMQFTFRGKSGKDHQVQVHDPRIARILRRCQELPGQELFGYRDADGEIHHIGSQDVNDYLREIAGENYTAKDFRTWIGTVLAALAFRSLQAPTSPTDGKRNVGTVVQSVAKMLGNTPAICRKCYIHPHIIESYLEGSTFDTISPDNGDLRETLHRLGPVEAAVLALLKRRSRRKGAKQAGQVAGRIVAKIGG